MKEKKMGLDDILICALSVLSAVFCVAGVGLINMNYVLIGITSMLAAGYMFNNE